MKKITLSVLTALAVCFTVNAVRSYREVDSAAEKLIRLHVIANSDTESDQQIKLKVRDSVLDLISGLVVECKTKEEALGRLSEGIDKITAQADKTLSEIGVSYDANVSVGREEFGVREYDNFTLPAAEYDSLIIRLGDAAGKNWWCVCYPGLCFSSAVSIDDCETFTDGELVILKEPEKVRYKLWCFEAIRWLKKLFR